jgi:hypothetical protein
MSQANTSNTPSRRALLAGVPAVAGAALAGAAGVNVAAIATTTGPDPIFAVIDAYREANRAFGAACRDETVPDEVATEACHANWRAFDVVLETMPTTVSGIAAVLELLAAPEYGGEDYSLLGLELHRTEMSASLGDERVDVGDGG